MSLPDEKYRSIFRMREVLVAICYSRKCKIPAEWRTEIYYAIKHAPFPSDKIKIAGYHIKDEEIWKGMDLEKYVSFIDGLIKPKTFKKKSKGKMPRSKRS